jgi:hypothetical protein
MTDMDANSTLRSDKANNRNAYFREYYRNNRNRLLEYQREYSLRFKKKMKRMTVKPAGRNAIKEVYNLCDIMKASPEKAALIINRITTGDRSFTMSGR